MSKDKDTQEAPEHFKLPVTELSISGLWFEGVLRGVCGAARVLALNCKPLPLKPWRLTILGEDGKVACLGFMKHT